MKKNLKRWKIRKINHFKFSDIGNFLNNFFNKFKLKLGKIRYLFLIYFLITIIGSLLLYSKFSQKENIQVSYIDALFTSSSAFSDTGIVTRITSETWSITGQAIIAILILIGGIGFFILKVYFFNFIFKRSLNMFSKEVLAVEQGINKIKELKEVIIISLTTIFIILLFSSFYLTFYFYYVPGNFLEGNQHNNPYQNWELAFRYGFFHSITALNNAGFDLMGTNSLAPYYFNYSLQIWLIFLIIIGGIGYPVIFDLYKWVESLIKKNKKRHKFSLFSKISLITYFLVSILAIILILIFEINSKNSKSFWNLQESDPNFWGFIDSKTQKSYSYNYGTNFDKVMNMIFSVFSTRSAGYSTLDFFDYNEKSLGLLATLMFIGAAPTSTGGGIRTITLAIIIWTIISRMTGRHSTHMFKRKIKESTVNQAFIVFSISIILVLTIAGIVSTSFPSYDKTQMMIMEVNENFVPKRKYTFVYLLFETTSVFGTSGISVGISSQLNTVSKIALILLMFIGRLGISSTVLIWGSNRHKFVKFEYVEEDLIIG